MRAESKRTALHQIVSELVQANRPAVVDERRSNALVAAQALSLKHNSPVRVDRAKGRTASNARTAAFGGHGWSKTTMVDLRGCYSNPQVVEAMALAEQAIKDIKIDGERFCSRAPRRRWRLTDRLGEQIILQVVNDRRSGMTKLALAKRYGISLSSVKRILRQEVLGATEGRPGHRSNAPLARRADRVPRR
jgi:hypothetical protein